MFPAYATMMNRVGSERGWPPLVRQQFEARPHAARRDLLRRPAAGGGQDPRPARAVRPPALPRAHGHGRAGARQGAAGDRAARDGGRTARARRGREPMPAHPARSHDRRAGRLMDEDGAGTIAFDSGAGRWVLAVAVLGSGIAFLDGTVVNVALPDIGARPRRVDERAAVDPQRLPADARLADPARRLARRPHRPAADLRARGRPGSPSPRCCARSRRTPRC